jgi:hypothetical protein|tara:strand:+ start:216 stop:437 length:222 start_codon:yes stop_codon:yes gene_type:complete
MWQLVVFSYIDTFNLESMKGARGASSFIDQTIVQRERCAKRCRKNIGPRCSFGYFKLARLTAVFFAVKLLQLE